MVALLGGRSAEEEIFGTGYSGAADDLARVHLLCRQMVAEFGMGVATELTEEAPIALPTGELALSDQTRREVDRGAMELARAAHRHARELLHVNRRCLDDLASAALERETLTREELDAIFDAQELSEPVIHADDDVDIESALAELARQQSSTS